jgi:hypothetical protein
MRANGHEKARFCCVDAAKSTLYENLITITTNVHDSSAWMALEEHGRS